MIHLIPPPNFNPKFDVVGAYITANGKLLMLQRSAVEEEANTWGQPAGKLEIGEDPLRAMVRELKEELGLIVAAEDLKFFRTLYVQFPTYDITYHMFGLELEEDFAVTLDPNEHQAHAWVAPIEAMQLNLIPNNEQTIKLFFNLE